MPRRTLDDALAIWSGPLLPELADVPVVIDAARRADGLRLSAIEAAGHVRLELGEHAAAAALLEPEAIAHPGRERLAAILALAQYRGQRQADALATIRRCRRELRESSGLAVGAELEQLEVDILDHAVGLDQPAVGRPTRRRRETAAAITPRRRRHPPLVGRDRELDAADGLLDSVRPGTDRRWWSPVSPASARRASPRRSSMPLALVGWTTAWARCAEHRSTPPLWVAAQLAEQLGHDGLDLTVASPSAPGETADEARFQVFRSFIDGLAATDHPLVVVIDDLQWADPDSLRLIEHLAVELAVPAGVARRHDASADRRLVRRRSSTRSPS